MHSWDIISSKNGIGEKQIVTFQQKHALKNCAWAGEILFSAILFL